MAYGREINIEFSGINSGGHYCSPDDNYTLPQNFCGTKLNLLEWTFVVPSTKCTCVMMIMLFNQLLDMPPLSGRWIILANEKFSPAGMKTKLCKIFERNKLFVYFWDLFISAHETRGPTLYVLRLYLYFCSVYLARTV